MWLTANDNKDPDLSGLPLVLHVEDTSQLQYQEAGAVKLIVLGDLQWPDINVRASLQCGLLVFVKTGREGGWVGVKYSSHRK